MRSPHLLRRPPSSVPARRTGTPRRAGVGPVIGPVIGLVVGLVVGLAGTAAAAPAHPAYTQTAAALSHASPHGVRNGRVYRGQRIRIVQANLESGQPVRRFQSDVARVLRQRPDVVTYNEVAYRHAGVLAPRPYRVWHHRGKYAGETAVAWNTRHWQLLDRGTFLVTHVKGRTAHQTVQWGIRYASWITVRNRHDHRVVSVVAAHTAPKSRITRGLTPVSIRRIAKLTDRLAHRGPVLVGGDFNMGYRSRDYPTALLARKRLVPTYAVVGRSLPTGDHHGATIDYLFTRGVSRFLVGNQRTLRLNSDHDALTADFQPLPRWTSTRRVPFPSGHVLSDPTGTRLDQRALLDTLVSAIANAPRGTSVRLATRHLTQPAVVQALIDARRRGARVQVVTGGRHRTAGEWRLLHRLGGRPIDGAWSVRRDGALLGHPATRLLVGRAGTSDRVSITLRVGLGPAVVHGARRASVVDETCRVQRGLTRSFFAMARHG